MIIFATHNRFDKEDVPIMTWHKAKYEPSNAVVNFTYNLSDERIVHLGNGKKEFLANSCGYLTRNCIFAFIKADNLEECMEILKGQYPLLKTDGKGARYIGIHIRELGVPERLTKVYDNVFYNKQNNDLA